MKLKVIKTEPEHAAALAYVETLMDAEEGSAAEANLELWALLIEKYEEENFPIAAPDPVTAIQFRMEQQGMTQHDLSKLVGSKSRTSEILRRRRPLSLNMIRILHSSLGIPTDLLIQAVRPRSAVVRGSTKTESEGRVSVIRRK